MIIKVNLSYCIEFPEDYNLSPLNEISEKILRDDGLWDILSEGNRIYNRSCKVKKLEEQSD